MYKVPWKIAEPIRLNMAGSRLKQVLFAEDVLHDPAHVGSRIAVIGGGMIGDSLEPRTILEAIEEGYLTGCAI